MEKPVFVVGQPRSASQWIMSAINTYTECCMIHELHLARLWRRGNGGRIDWIARSTRRDRRVALLRRFLFSDRVIGCFWKMRDREYTVHRLEDRDLDRALGRVHGAETLLRAMMEAQRRHYGKPRCGARHPVHYLFLGRLLRWFPDARVLFLTRPMREIARSWRAKRVPAHAPSLAKAVMGAGITLQSCSNALLAKPFLAVWRDDPRVLEVRYHDLVARPEEGFRRICEHLRLTFDPRMADRSRVVDSAYDESTQRGLVERIEWSPSR